METGTVKEIEDLTSQLAQIVVTAVPKTPADWDALEKLTAAHKQLRSIDILSLVEKPPRAGLTR